MQNKKKGHLSHLKMMALCCGAPILILFLLPLFGYTGVLQRILPFLCPIMMIVMIPMMMRGHGNNCSKESDHTEIKSIEESKNTSM